MPPNLYSTLRILKDGSTYRHNVAIAKHADFFQKNKIKFNKKNPKTNTSRTKQYIEDKMICT